MPLGVDAEGADAPLGLEKQLIQETAFGSRQQSPNPERAVISIEIEPLLTR